MSKALFISLLFFSANSFAETVYSFFLTPNNQILASCRNDQGGDMNSKLKLAMSSQGSDVRLQLKFKVCTAKYGVRAISTFINLPKQVAQDAFLSSLPVGASKVFEAVRSAQSNGQNNITVTRLANQGTMATFRLTWSPDRNNATPNEPVLFFQETDANKIADLDRRLGGHFPWARITYTYKQLLVGTIVLDGRLKEKNQETM